MYSVIYFDEHPDKTNDALTAHDFATLAEAEAFVRTDPLATDRYYGGCTRYIVIDGPDLPDIRIIKNRHYKANGDGKDWLRERSMQAGMMGGAVACNDARGF